MAENKTPRIVVDDGAERVPVYNRRGDEIGAFYFYPTDVGIIDRYAEMASGFDSIVEPLTSVNIAADGSAAGENTDEIAALHEAEQRLYVACDKLFGGNFSEVFFGKVHPFSPVNGHFYCENVLNAVGAFISERFGRELQRINARVDKYLKHGQRTGKHAKGKQ